MRGSSATEQGLLAWHGSAEALAQVNAARNATDDFFQSVLSWRQRQSRRGPNASTPAGESLRVHPGHVGMFEAGMAFELERIKGIKNILFGADALFLAKLTYYFTL